MRSRRLLPTAIALALAAGLTSSHPETEGARFITPTGVDAATCLDHHAPCRSLAYALSKAEPGNMVRVAAGRYDVTGIAPENFLWGTIKARGGYSAADEFEHEDTAANVTEITGLDVRYAEVLAGRGFRWVENPATGPGSSEPLQAVATAPSACLNGFAGQFPCQAVDLLAQVPLAQISSRPVSAANVWGFVDRNDDREYALIGLNNGLGVFDVTDPTAPREVGVVPGNSSTWREVKVFQFFDGIANRYQAYAYVTTEAPGSGLQVIDLTQLPNSVSLANTLRDTGSQHTLYISNVDYASNTALAGATPLLFVAGSNVNGGAWRAYSLANPASPTLVATAPAGTGYMHDSTSLRITDNRTTQCDQGHNPCDVLVDFDTDSVDLWDVTEPSRPVLLSRTAYPNVRYTHSGWPNADQRFIVVHDELDEVRIAGLNTSIYTLDISDLRAPSPMISFQGPDTTTDHNGYSKGSLHYVSHYRRGLVVFDESDPRDLREVGHFDTFLMDPANVAGFDGAWGVYPFLPSGVILISDIDNGLFVLQDNTAALPPSAGRLGFTSATQSVAERDGQAVLRVRRSDGTQGAVSVQYTTQDGSAVAGSDYAAVSGTLNWAAGDLADRTIAVAITNDGQMETSEQFTVQLTGPAGGASLGQADLSVVIGSDVVVTPRSSGGGGFWHPFALLLLALRLRRGRR